jgi:hypothetical protein
MEFEESPLTTGILQGGQEPVLSRGFQQGLLVGVLTLAGALLLAWITSSFLAGAILSTYSRAPARFEWRPFLGAGWHWFGAFLLFNALQALAALVVFLILLTAVGPAGRLAWPVIALFLALWLAWTESTRAIAVRHGTRNVFRSAGRAAVLIFRRPGSILAFYAFGAAALVMIHLGFRLGLMPHLPLEQWPLVLLVGQAFILLRLWARLARWAGLMEMAGDQAPRLDENAREDLVP